MNPLRRESMLEETNRLALDSVVADECSDETILDLGCGLGATSRHGVMRYPNKRFFGISVVPSHRKEAERRSQDCTHSGRLKFLTADFRDLPFPDRSIDGCYAIESAVYASGADKSDLIKEVARVLKPGGRLVIIDCFLKHREELLPAPIRWAYQKICRAWALPCSPEIEPFLKAMASNDLRVTLKEDISWKVAPSVMHAPFAVAAYTLKNLLQRQSLSQYTKSHLLACALCPVLGVWRSSFSYYVLRAIKE